jgi:hypothetical protein
MPRREHADMAQYRKRVSFSLKTSSAKTPEGCGKRLSPHLAKREGGGGGRGRCGQGIVSRIWIAPSVERMWASCPECALKGRC